VGFLSEDNESSGSINGETFLDKISNYQLLIGFTYNAMLHTCCDAKYNETALRAQRPCMHMRHKLTPLPS
jgi:hypothetical protein